MNPIINKLSKDTHTYANTIDGLLEELSDLLLKGEIRGEVDEELQDNINTIKNLLEAAATKEDKR